MRLREQQATVFTVLPSYLQVFYSLLSWTHAKTRLPTEIFSGLRNITFGVAKPSKFQHVFLSHLGIWLGGVCSELPSVAL
jgi:hypothetical protein